jgi:transposase
MLPTLKNKVYVFQGRTDMRVSFDRLSEIIKDHNGLNARDGGLYVFFNSSRDKVKILYWDEDGYALWYKRLESGRFKVKIEEGCEELIGEELKLLLSGMELSRVKYRRKNVQ